jgi:predicted dehydrogenase
MTTSNLPPDAGDAAEKCPPRRAFLKQSAALTAAATLGTVPRLWAADTAPKKIRIGVVGGRFGATFQWHEHPDCVVAAVSDLRPERRDKLMRTYKCAKAYESLEKMVLDKDLDAIAVFTEATNHVKHVEAAMRNGKHVISAVPAAWNSLDECHKLVNIVRSTGLTYMMAETSYYQQITISARKFFQEGKFGDVFYCESEYLHPGLSKLWYEKGERTWRYGGPPMPYPTHCTSHLVSVTGRRLGEVVCHGWGDDAQEMKDNAYENPFWNETAMFKDDQGHGFRVRIWWNAPVRGCERADWYGTKMSLSTEHPNGLGAIIVRNSSKYEKDTGGFDRSASPFEQYQVPEWWKTDLLPPPLRHDSGHQGSHCFLTHEFIDALVHDRQPTVNLYEALAYTVPGIIAHQSALKGGVLLKIPSFDPPKAT